MIRWCVVIQKYQQDNELTVCNSKEEAISIARKTYNRLKKQTSEYIRVFVGKANVGENGYYTKMDNGYFDKAIREVAWENGGKI